MGEIWIRKKKSLVRTLKDYSSRSPVMDLESFRDHGDEIRAVVKFFTNTLVTSPDDSVRQEGPVAVGLRYHESFLSEVPHPLTIATVLVPSRVHLPNCFSPSGAICLGIVKVGFSFESILNQIWAGLNVHMDVTNTEPGQIVNKKAADYVRSRADEFPISDRGLFELPENGFNGSKHKR